MGEVIEGAQMADKTDPPPPRPLFRQKVITYSPPAVEEVHHVRTG